MLKDLNNKFFDLLAIRLTPKKLACVLGLFLFFVVFPLPPLTGGTIQVIVTDQAGNNIKGPFEIEAFHRGQSVAHYYREDFRSIDIAIPSSALGTYFVQAKWTFQKTVPCQNECFNQELGKIYEDGDKRPYVLGIDNWGQAVKKYSIDSIQIVKTYVKEGETDKVRISLETREDKLWFYASSLVRDPKITPLWKPVAKESAEQIIKGFSSKIISNALTANLATMFVVDVASAVTEASLDPEKDLQEAFSEIASGLLFKGTLTAEGYVIAWFLGYSGKAALGYIGAAFFVGEMGYTSWQWLEEEKRCSDSQSDDLEFIFGQRTDKPWGNTAGYECGIDSNTWRCPITIINRGNPLYDFYLSEEPPHLPYNPDIPLPPVIPFLGEEEKNITISTVYGIANNLEFIASNYKVPLNYLFCQHKDIRITNFKRNNPYARINYPQYSYLGRDILIEANIYSEDGLKEGLTKIIWQYKNESSFYSQDMTRVEGNQYQGKYRLTITPPHSGFIKFYLYTQDSNGEELDTRLEEGPFEMKVIEDAFSRGDAPDSGGRLDIANYSNGQKLGGYLLARINDETDWYRFPVQRGQKVEISVKSDKRTLINLYNIWGYVENSWSAQSSDNQLVVSGEIFASQNGFMDLALSSAYPIPEIIVYEFSVKVSGNPILDPPQQDGNQDSKQNSESEAKIDSVSNGGPKVRIKKIGGKEVVVGKILEIKEGDFQYECAFNDSGDLILLLDVVEFKGSITAKSKAKSCINNIGSKKCTECYQGLYFPRAVNYPNWYAYNGFFLVPADRLEDGKTYEIWVQLQEPTQYKCGKRICTRDSITKSQNVKIKISRDGVPTVNSISAVQKLNSINFTISLSDDKGLDKMGLYRTGYEGAFYEKYLGGSKNVTINYSWDTSNQAPGAEYTVWAEVYDKSENWARSKDIKVTIISDKEPPLIDSIIILPTSNGNFFNNYLGGTVTLSALVGDSGSGIKEIRWSLDGTTIGSGEKLNWNSRDFNQGKHSLKLEAWDNAGNYSWQNQEINIDNNNPQISIVKPLAGERIGESVELIANTSDGESGILKTEWFLLSNGKWQTIALGESTIWHSGEVNGDKTLKALTTDMGGNLAEQSLPVYIAGQPDLKPTVISFEPKEPKAGENVEITIIVENKGEREAKDFEISLAVDGQTLGTSTMVLNGFSQSSLKFSWLAKAGKHSFLLIIDSKGKIKETDENNNFLAADLNVSEGEGLPGFKFKKTIKITERSGQNLTDYQIFFDINLKELVSKGELKPDLADIRFIDPETQNELSHWIEGKSSPELPNILRIWIKIPFLTANSTKTIYMYYGSSEANSKSNADNTFLLYDDFNDGVLDQNKWVDVSNSGGYVSETGGIIQLVAGGSMMRGWLRSRNQIEPENIEIAFRGRRVHTWGSIMAVMHWDGNHSCGYDSPNACHAFNRCCSAHYQVSRNESNCNARGVIDEKISPSTQWFTYKFNYYQGQIQVWENSTLRSGVSSTTLPSNIKYIGFANREQPTHSRYRAEIDWVYVRQFVLPEPAATLEE